MNSAKYISYFYNLVKFIIHFLHLSLMLSTLLSERQTELSPEAR